MKFLRNSILIIFCFIVNISFSQTNNAPPNFNNLDTIYNNKDKSFAVGPFRKVKDFKGDINEYWKEFYKSGELKAEGELITKSFTQCCIDGPCEMPYKYKVRFWKYYYKNGKIRSKGNYITQIYNFPTSCEGGDDIVIQKVNSNWKNYDIYGKELKISKRTKEELEAFYTDYGIHYLWKNEQ